MEHHSLFVHKKPEEDELAAVVMEYLREHPDAMDTAEGIADFWFDRSLVKVELRRLMKVLDTLVQLGLLLEVRKIDGALYRLNSAGCKSAGEHEIH